MRLDKEKVEDLLTSFVYEDEAGLEFRPAGFKEEDLYWYIGFSGVYRVGGKNPLEGEREWTKIEPQEFLKEVEGQELVCRVWLGWKEGKEVFREIEDWETLSKIRGVTEMVVLATKVPKIIGRRFEHFANEESSRSDVLRKLVINYIKEQMIEKANSIIFRDF